MEKKKNLGSVNLLQTSFSSGRGRDLSGVYIPPTTRPIPLTQNMITINQFIQTTSYLFAIAIAMALSVSVFVKDILALLTFRASSTAAPEYPRIAVTVKVEVVTTRYSTTEPTSCVTYDSSTLVKLSSECYSNARVGKRNRLP
ncbi:hypothetical protein ARMGADRAFT_1059849 [Armillaria gallica]|uniref:Uncharacterized protein n=1 Tax=Armillaria gallica TaxID=47427 RepID=A0A2H3E0I2_ARMGA|nr:hypothetical protein ARMGADRAFT_1059849 [Armillaria gallica]